MAWPASSEIIKRGFLADVQTQDHARANPDVLLGGQPFQAEVIEDETSRVRLWELADRVFPAFASYRDSAALAGRAIPILQLVPSKVVAGRSDG